MWTKSWAKNGTSVCAAPWAAIKNANHLNSSCEFVDSGARGRVRQCGKLHASDYTRREMRESAKRQINSRHNSKNKIHIIGRCGTELKIGEARFPHKLSLVAADLSAHLLFPPHAQHSNYLAPRNATIDCFAKKTRKTIYIYWASAIMAQGRFAAWLLRVRCFLIICTRSGRRLESATLDGRKSRGEQNKPTTRTAERNCII